MSTSNLLTKTKSEELLPTYPLIGSFPSIVANQDRVIQWTSDILLNSPSSSFILHRPFGQESVLTSNPANVKHMLETSFNVYQKGDTFRNTLSDLFGQGTFLADGEQWKSQRQVLSHEFDNQEFVKFFQSVVSSKIINGLIPVLSHASANKLELNFQDILERFGLDTICNVACGYDDNSLLPSLPPSVLGQAFHDALRISNQRFSELLPIIWRTKRFLNIGSEKELRNGLNVIQNFLKESVEKKKDEVRKNKKSQDFLSLLLFSGITDDNFLKDMVINFILAGLESVSAALTWYFWLISKNPEREAKILDELNEDSSDILTYTHASIYESLRIYPSVPVNSRTAVQDDVMPDGTQVKKGSRVSYHNYAMGRSEKLWGNDWEEFKPERFLKRDENDGKLVLVRADQFDFPQFHAGPRTCMGREMATWQMKRVIAAVLRQFKVVAVMDQDGYEPKFISYFNSKMEGGFPVKIVERV
ncbi:cytochrome P450 94A2-like [Apium graveolens]|uniref:cytochrome P450 94A2-like n=1 Tax=Apium graveolens TaxID=4045 RepID=UPI003D7B7D6F